MRCVRKWRTLICYAGSASEASIGSRPLGSELNTDMVIVWLKSQGRLNGQRGAFPSHQASGERP